MHRPHRLRTEHLDDALGTDVVRPRLSWRLPRAAAVQHGYRIQAGDWDSGWIISADSVLVPFTGPETPLLRPPQAINANGTTNSTILVMRMASCRGPPPTGTDRVMKLLFPFPENSSACSRISLLIVF